MLYNFPLLIISHRKASTLLRMWLDKKRGQSRYETSISRSSLIVGGTTIGGTPLT
jgi:hypothetical protein